MIEFRLPALVTNECLYPWSRLPPALFLFLRQNLPKLLRLVLNFLAASWVAGITGMYDCTYDKCNFKRCYSNLILVNFVYILTFVLNIFEAA